MQIIDTLERVPGGLVLAVMFAGSLLRTFAPGLLDMGGYVTAMVNGTDVFMGVLLFCMGTKINLRRGGHIMKRGVAMIGAKFTVGMVIGYIVAKVGGVFGLSAVAVTAAMTNTNGVLGIALIDKYGDPDDVAAIAVRLIGTGPLLTLIVLGVAGQVDDLARSILVTILPLVLGMVLGSLDEKASNLFGVAVTGIVPISMFAVGSRINLFTAIEAGVPGIVLGLFAMTVSFLVCVWADRRTGGNGIAGATLASTAANAVLTPAAVASVVPSFNGLALTHATSQVAAAAILTSLLTPVLVGLVRRSNGTEAGTPGRDVAARQPAG